MTKRMLTTLGVVVLLYCGGGGLAVGDSPQPVSPPQGALPPNFPSLEQIMERACHNIGRRYNLNDEQLAATLDLMKKRVYEFLADNHDEVWPLLRDLTLTQLGTNPDVLEGDQLKRLGKGALPLLEKAKKAILDGNQEWAKILTPQQLAKHQFDLEKMEEQFQAIEDNFQNWADGVPTEQGIFPPPRYYPDDPPTPEKPPDGIPKLPKPEVSEITLGLFETRVEEFIREYQLDNTQIESARSIMREYQEKARQHQKRHEQDFAQLAADREKAFKAKDRKAIAAADERERELRKPIQESFGQMEERLMALLTQAQRERGPVGKSGSTKDRAAKSTKPDSSKDEPKTEVRKRLTPNKSNPAPEKDTAKEAEKKPGE